VLIELTFFQLYPFESFNLILEVIIDWLKSLIKHSQMIALHSFSDLDNIVEEPVSIFDQPLGMDSIVPSSSHWLLDWDAQPAFFDFKLVVNLLELFFCGDKSLTAVSVIFGCVSWVELFLFGKEVPLLLTGNFLEPECFDDCRPA